MSRIQDRLPRLAPLAACFSLMFGVDHAAAAATLLVTDCTDGAGSGTLRQTIAAADTGDTVQIPATCSRITLRTGQIKTTLADLTISGLGATRIAIDGGRRASPPTDNTVIAHYGTGTLRLTDLTVTGGKYTGNASQGACVFSKGSVALVNAVVTDCELFPPANGQQDSKGAGIYAVGQVFLSGSTVSDSVARAADAHTSIGAGVFAKGGMFAKYSTVSGNVALPGSNGTYSRAGGAYVVATGLSLVGYSTFSGNQASINAALQVVPAASGQTNFDIKNSTISGNHATVVQAVGTYLPTSVRNSTIAFNTAANGPSVAPVGLYSSQQITMQSSIFANNIGANGDANDVFSGASTNPLVGANNLIVATSQPAVPLGTLSACPKLGHLGKHGGQTQTLALAADSPAIDAGNNASAFTHDQRNIGFARVVGASADIGAFEKRDNDLDDTIFFGQFEGRCD